MSDSHIINSMKEILERERECVCVCEREREGETEKQGETEREREKKFIKSNSQCPVKSHKLP